MGFGKNLGISAILFILLNFIFAILAMVLQDTSMISTYFTSIPDNPTALIGDLLLPASSPIWGSASAISQFGSDTVDIGVAIISLLWVLIPGIVAAAFSSWKFADESPRTAYWSSTLGIFLVAAIGAVLIILLGDGALALKALEITSIPIGSSNDIVLYVVIFVELLLVALFFGGWGAMASSSF